MASLQVTPAATFTEWIELNFQGLYLYHMPLGSEPNQAQVIANDMARIQTIAAPNKPRIETIGYPIVNSWSVYDGPGPDAKLVAFAHGLRILTGNWFCSFSLVFVNQRFSGSTLEVTGWIEDKSGELAVVRGTGQFAMASGIISQKFIEHKQERNIIELAINAFCPVLKGTKHSVAKIGPWGGSGGSPMDITEEPQHLKSITVSTGIAVISIAFSYVDYAGQNQSAGRWGGSGGEAETIQLAESEVLTELSGTIGNVDGHTVITSIKFVTSLNKTYGPFGAWGEGMDTPFTVPVQQGSGIVGFFARAEIYLDAVGVYVRPL